MFAGNDFVDRSCCALVASLICMPHLKELSMDAKPMQCIRSVHWSQAGLDVPPDEIVRRNDWLPVLKFLRAGPTVPVHELRLMLVGDGEVGKTSLLQAFLSENHRAKHIPKKERTVGIDMQPLAFPCCDAGPAITCQVCDFAGQEIYYLSHTLHFTRRCLYLLMWTTHKFSDSDAAIALGFEDVVGPLKRWLQLLAANVPEANVVVVGTHCKVDPDAFAVMQQRVDDELK